MKTLKTTSFVRSFIHSITHGISTTVTVEILFFFSLQFIVVSSIFSVQHDNEKWRNLNTFFIFNNKTHPSAWRASASHLWQALNVRFIMLLMANLHEQIVLIVLFAFNSKLVPLERWMEEKRHQFKQDLTISILHCISSISIFVCSFAFEWFSFN